MSDAYPDPLPMRANLFGRWLNIWHALYIGGLLITLGVAVWQTRGSWGWEELALVAIVLVLMAIYLRAIVFARRWPHPVGYLLAYYALVLALFAVAIYLNPIFLYALGMLFGQMFGVLPPVLALPGVLAVVALFALASAGWRVPDFSWAGVLFVGAQIALMMLLYVYIYHLIRTSQERARLVEELQAANEKVERARQQESELAVLRERERLARDLHDGLGHALVALTMQLEAVQRLYPVDPAAASERIDQMKTLTRDSMAGLRRALEGLRAPGLGERPLADALHDLADGLHARAGIRVACGVDPAAGALRPMVAETVWRVAQEALTNVERHAGAASVSLAVTVQDGQARLIISDDGAGLPDGAERLPGHYGLRGMRERVEALGGTLAFGPGADGRGTLIVARVPLDPAAHERDSAAPPPETALLRE